MTPDQDFLGVWTFIWLLLKYAGPSSLLVYKETQLRQSGTFGSRLYS